MILDVSQEVLQHDTVLVPQVVGNVWPNTVDFPKTPPGCPQVFQFKAQCLWP